MSTKSAPSLATTLTKDLKRNKIIYLMLVPVVAYFLIFQYGPMYGVQIAFKDFSPAQGIWGSSWVGLQNFESFFNSFYFSRIVKNTLILSLYDLIFTFPAPIILALLINEVRSHIFRRTVQSLTYLPHFISIVVVVGMMIDFMSIDGMINRIIIAFGGEAIPFFQEAGWFRTLYIGSAVWKEIGWGSIIYLAAITTIDPTLYEAAKVDGAGRFRQIINVTIPGIMPTIIILLILRIGSMLALGDEKILLMYNPSIYETSDVIGTFVYRKGLLESNFSYSAAVGLLNSVINFILLILANYTSKKFSETKLW
ncbi:ABC transporter permease [Paenibacillus sp. strain BS8-2]